MRRPRLCAAAAALLCAPRHSDAAGGEVGGPPVPTKAQLQMMDMGLSQFMHFSVDPFTSIEHNCVKNNADCIPASKFQPTNLSTDQWVETAVAFGAGEICLTAHHEGGFCLWDTKYSNYSVMHSPYGKDVVAQFVASCKKYGVKPCYYMGPNANGYLSNELKVSADEFVERQLGMLRELLTNYGTDYVSRLWWDHYPSGCGGLAPCPSGSFPAAWPRFVQLVRDLSPSTIICPGPDCDGHQGESGVGKYPVWFPCNPNKGVNGTVLTCKDHASDGSLTGFHPYEACATMHNGWFCKGDGDDAHNSYWTPATIWQHYMQSVGIGWVNTLNAPPGTTGQIPGRLPANMKAFGDALRALLEPVTPSASVTGAALRCNASALELDLGAAVEFNAVMTREDLSHGQLITSYEVDYSADGTSWATFPACGSGCTVPGGAPAPSAKIPSVPLGQCGAVMEGINLVYDAPPGCHMIGKMDDTAACEAACRKDPQCNFFTWHDANQGKAANECYLRYGATYDYHPQSGHFSGVCNHTLSPGVRGGDGVRGQSVGARLIDFVPATTARKVRFRCTASMAPDGEVHIRSFSVHKSVPPS